MAVNWTATDATRVILEGTNKEQIQDITRRFPLFAVSVAKQDILAITDALPAHLTVRKVESVMKDGIDTIEGAEETDLAVDKVAGKNKKKAAKAVEPEIEEDEEEVEEAPVKPAKKAKGKKKAAPAPEPEPEIEDEDEDEDEDGYDDMSLVQLKKEAKKQKVNIKGLKTTEDIIAALRGEDADEEDEDEDDDEDWDI